MITESDLRAVLTEEARDIAEPAEILAELQLPEPHERRRWLAPVAAAAAVVAAVTVAGVVAADRHSGPSFEPAASGRDLRFTVTVGPVAGYDVTSYRELAAQSELTWIMRPGGNGTTDGSVTAYAAGAYDPTDVKKGQKVPVQGHLAYYAQTRRDPYGNDLEPTLAWEFAPNRWVVIEGWNAATAHEQHVNPLAEEKRVAAAVNTAANEPLLLPFRIGSVPAGLRRVSGKSDLHPQGLTSWSGALAYTSATYSYPLQVDVFSKLPSDHLDTNLTVNGHPARFDDRVPPSPQVPSTFDPAAPVLPTPISRAGGTGRYEVLVDIGNAYVRIRSDLYSKAELVKIAESIQLASNVEDRSTWFDANQ